MTKNPEVISIEAESLKVNLSPIAFRLYSLELFDCFLSYTPVRANFSHLQYYLLCRSIEMGLKALHLESTTQAQVKSKLSHRIYESWQTLSHNHQPVLSDVESKLLKELDQLYHQPDSDNRRRGLNKSFEYPQPYDFATATKDFPSLSEVTALARKITKYDFFSSKNGKQELYSEALLPIDETIDSDQPSGSLSKDQMNYPYVTRLDIKYNHLELIDIPAMVTECTDSWFNQTLTKVNSSVVRVGIVQGEYHWHKHDNDDEFFFVLSGKLLVDVPDKTFVLAPQQGVTIPKGIMHRTRALEPTVMLMVETSAIQPTGD